MLTAFFFDFNNSPQKEKGTDSHEQVPKLT